MPEGQTFGQWVRAVRLSKRLRAFECADRAEMAKQTWSDIENDRSRSKSGDKAGETPQYRRETMEAVAKGLDVSYEEVLTAAGYIPDQKPAPQSIGTIWNPDGSIAQVMSDMSQRPATQEQVENLTKLIEGLYARLEKTDVDKD